MKYLWRSRLIEEPQSSSSHLLVMCFDDFGGQLCLGETNKGRSVTSSHLEATECLTPVQDIAEIHGARHTTSFRSTDATTHTDDFDAFEMTLEEHTDNCILPFYNTKFVLTSLWTSFELN